MCQRALVLADITPSDSYPGVLGAGSVYGLYDSPLCRKGLGVVDVRAEKCVYSSKKTIFKV